MPSGLGFALMAGSVLGTGWQLQQPQVWPLAQGLGALAACAVAVGAWCLAWRRARWASRWPVAAWLALALALCLGIAGGAALAGLRATWQMRDALAPALEGRDVRLSGRVLKMPQRGEMGARFVFEAGPGSGRTVDDGAPAALPPRLLLAWYVAPPGAAHGAAPERAAPPSPVHAGERWQLTARLKAPHGTLNPHGFDQELWLWSQGVQATGTVRPGDARRLEAAGALSLERGRESVRDAILARAPSGAGGANATGVTAALVTGDQSAIERDGWALYRATGVAHLMSISGLHVTMFAWLAALLAGTLWRRSAWLMLACPAPLAAQVGGVLLAALYAAFSGGGVPSQRTVWMLAVAALLRAGGRRWPWPFAWLAVCWVVVMVDPCALLQAGFWLSFVAVGVLFASEAGGAGRAPAGWRARGLALLREQWVVTLALTPLTLLLFQQVSLVGLPANLIAIPWVTLVVTPLAMAGVLCAPLWDAAALAVRALDAVLQYAASWPVATVALPAPPLWATAAGLGGGLLLAMRLPLSLRVLAVPLLLPALLWQPPRPPAGRFELLAADIGQGNAVLVRTARHALLYDAGPRLGADSDAGQRTLVPLLRALGERPQLLVLSHRDIDHTGGARAVLDAHPQAGLVGSLEPGHPLLALRAQRRCEAGQRWEWDGVAFELLHPLPQDYQSFTRPNAISCVLRVRAADGTAALLAGDIEAAQEAALVARHAAGGEGGLPGQSDALRADLLLVPHHGSRTSSSAALLAAVRPRIALVQAGYLNRFGHPAPTVVARLRAHGIQVADSTHCAAMHWRSHEPGVLACERDRARRFWHHRPP